MENSAGNWECYIAAVANFHDISSIMIKILGYNKNIFRPAEFIQEFYSFFRIAILK